MPAGQVRYDNLTPAVKKVVFRSRWREENPCWTSFHEYYGFTPFYCEPGLRGAHEKGGVEGQVGYFRRNYLTPVPQVDSLDELNARLAEFEAKEDERRIGARMRTIAQDFAREAGHLLPLPDDPFATGITLTPRVDRHGVITVKMCRYSVPVRFIDRKVTVTLTCDDLTVYDGRREVAPHRRLTGRGAEHLVLDHYLEALLTKPGALERSEALHQARAEGTFTVVHEAFWAAAKKTLGDIEGTKILVKVLLLHRHQQHADVVTRIRTALAAGTFNEDVIALEARKAAQAAGRAPTVTASAPPRNHWIRPRPRSHPSHRAVSPVLCPPIRVPCPAWSSGTSCCGFDGRTHHDHRPSRPDRTGIRRGDRHRLPAASSAHHASPGRRHDRTG
ncbi:hypothetical protein ABT404_18915 [Streptomyces hyaluromycini]|uniref:Transposase for insertion sequence element IS21-like C-terminal domain-containing protein n=1 Tax=Streptomyces hyaluromycini TaxID=1377993 RepID=A0ABV1WXS4_9ACTN